MQNTMDDNNVICMQSDFDCSFLEFTSAKIVSKLTYKMIIGVNWQANRNFNDFHFHKKNNEKNDRNVALKKRVDAVKCVLQVKEFIFAVRIENCVAVWVELNKINNDVT